MGLKQIFQEGMKERKRRKALNKVSGEFKDKEKVHAGQLTALGQKAWETRIDISAYADLKAALGDMQKALDDLRTQAELLQKQKQEGEAKKKQENERLNAALKDIESKKRQEDSQLSEKKNALQGEQKESQRALSRLAAIARERSQLQNKSANPAVTDAEKTEIAAGLELLAREEEELKSSNQAREAAGKPLAAAIAALQEESARLQKLLDEMRQEQKKVNSELDKQLTALAGELAKVREKTKEIEARQRLQFRDLGEKLANAQGVAPEIAKEMAAVLNARTEMQGVQSLIGGLERQKDEGQASAYKKMRAILIAAVLLVAALAVALFLLLSPKKEATPLEALLQGSGKTVQQLGRIADELEKKINEPGAAAKAGSVAPDAGNVIVDEILAAFDQCVAEAAALAKDKPEAAVLLPQLEKLYAGYGVKMTALNTRFLALRDRDIFAFRRANGYMSDNRPKHVFAKDNTLSQAIAYYNFEKGEQAVVDMLSSKIVRLLDEAVKQ
jgi:DNA repair exonuclease SbcCD ATPase subunit